MKSFRKTSIPNVALGAMSGTSLDGIDGAVLVMDGHDITVFGQTQYRRYTDTEQTVLLAALGHWSGPEVKAAKSVIDAVHAEAMAKFEDTDLVGFFLRSNFGPCTPKTRHLASG
jgi:anhydro-N-acetylmuramic acid kinase